MKHNLRRALLCATLLCSPLIVNAQTIPAQVVIYKGAPLPNFLNGLGVSPVGANPSAVISAAAVNGVAATFMRSDAAPALCVTCSYIFTASKITTSAASIAGSGFNIPAGAAPTSPVNGDLWTTSAGLYAQINGATVGPYTSGGGASGANPTAAIGLSAINGVAATFLRSDGAPALSQSIVPTWTAVHNYTQNTLNATLTDALKLSNTTAATVSQNQISPAIHLIGQGWKTNATAASQQVEWQIAANSFVDTASPNPTLTFTSTINGVVSTNPLVFCYTSTGSTGFQTGVYITFSGQAGTVCGNGVGSIGPVNAGGSFGLFGNNAETVLMSGGNTSNAGLFANSGASFGWSSVSGSGAFNGGQDTYLGRRSAAVVQLGAADAAAPVAQTLAVQSVVAGTTNTAGALFKHQDSAGTGTGTGGGHEWDVAAAGTTGTAQNAEAAAMTLKAATGLTILTAAQTPTVAVTFNATTMAVNCLLSNVFATTFTANVTVAPAINNPQDGQTINWFITQDATGTRTMTWPASFKWSGGTAGVLSTAINSVDLVVATYRSSTGFWYVSISKAFS